MRRKSFIRAGVASSLALLIAGALTGAPVAALADSNTGGGEQVAPAYEFIDPEYKLPLISECPLCNGATHMLDWSEGTEEGKFFYSTSGVGAEFLFGDKSANMVEVESSDSRLVSAYLDMFEGEQTVFITAEGIGSATITVKTDDGRQVQFTATGVDVSGDPVAMEHAGHYSELKGIEITNPVDGGSIELDGTNDPFSYYVDVIPIYQLIHEGDVPPNFNFTVTSSDSSVLSIENGYVLVPHKVGTVTLTVKANDVVHQGVSATDSITLNVVEGEDEPSDVVISNDSGASVVFTPSDPAEAEQWDGVTFVNEHLGGTAMDNAWNALITQVKGVKSGGYVFDLHLEKDGKVFAVPDGDSVKVTLPIPEGMGADGIHVFHVADDGTVTDMNAVVDAEAGTITFTTTHFSTFVVAQVASDASGSANSTDAPALPQTGDPSLLIVGMLSLSGVGAIALGARRRQ